MRAAWLFVTYLALRSFPGRFCSVFFQEHHLDQSQIGIIIAAPSLLSLAFSPICCGIADHFRAHELTTIVLFVISILSFLSQIPALPSLHLFSDSTRYYFLLAINVVYGVTSKAVDPLMTTIVLSQLARKYGERGYERYGKEYMFGVISSAVFHLTLGALLDVTHKQLWVVHAGIFGFGLVFFITLLAFTRSEKRAKQQEHGIDERTSLISEEECRESTPQVENSGKGSEEISVLSAIKQILFGGDISTIFFFNLVFWLAGGMSLVENLLFLFFENDLGASNLICGISVVIQVMFEMPVFSNAPELLAKHGPSRIVILGAISFVIRGVGYVLAPNAYFALLVEPLHGVTFATYKAASVSFVASRTPERYTAIGQSMLTVVEELGRTVGTSFGGYVMKTFGSKTLYGGAAALVFAATMLFAWVSEQSGKGGSNSSEEQQCLSQRT